MTHTDPSLWPDIRLKKGRDKALKNRHPWVFSGALAKRVKLPPGALVNVLAHDGQWLARGSYNPDSQLSVRALSWDPEEPFEDGWIGARIAAAVSRRPQLEGRRLVHLEADGLPGLIVDQYRDVLSVQILSPLMEQRRDEIVAALVEVVKPASVYERSDASGRKREGLEERAGLLWGAEPPDEIPIREGGGGREGVILIDVRGGQKTGFFLDQRVNRWRVAAHCEGRRVLNCFSYTGGFGVAALHGGAAKVVNVDVSAAALATAARMVSHNGFAAERSEQVKADVFSDLRRRVERDERWDVIVLDPPKFATHKARLNKACRGYKDINLQAMKLLRPGGVLATFSCSGLVTPPLFQSVVAGAAADAGRDVRVLERLTQPHDHPLLLSFPESEYLKGLLCRVD